ncbi:hypothetical protein [Synechococcus sp. M16CYN]|uniref:hypothetical protein n=1 Tax=Synechococcus sp. M16CYN TaxID=3103139 RepID=UPI00333EF4E2
MGTSSCSSAGVCGRVAVSVNVPWETRSHPVIKHDPQEEDSYHEWLEPSSSS